MYTTTSSCIFNNYVHVPSVFRDLYADVIDLFLRRSAFPTAARSLARCLKGQGRRGDSRRGVVQGFRAEGRETSTA